MESRIVLRAKKDISVCERFIKEGDEVRVGNIFSDGSRVMIIDMEENLHAWLDIKEYHESVKVEVE